jgi:hypothetical protein
MWYKSVWWWLSITQFLFKTHDTSETGFCLHLQVEPTQFDPIVRASPHIQTSAPKWKSKSHYNRRSVDQFVLVSYPFWSKWPDVIFIWVTITFFIFHLECPLWWEDGSVICSAMTQVQFQVTLRPTVYRPVRLGAGPPMGPITRF